MKLKDCGFIIVLQLFEQFCTTFSSLSISNFKIFYTGEGPRVPSPNPSLLWYASHFPPPPVHFVRKLHSLLHSEGLIILNINIELYKKYYHLINDIIEMAWHELQKHASKAFCVSLSRYDDIENKQVA